MYVRMYVYTIAQEHGDIRVKLRMYVVCTKPLGTEPLHTITQAVDWLLCTGFALADHPICPRNSSNTAI